MKLIVVLEVLSVQLLLVGGITYPAFADTAPATVIQLAQVVIRPQIVVQTPVIVEPQPVLVQPQPVLVQPQPVLVQPQIVFEPYPVLEGGVNILVDPEDYYYANGGVYYHYHYLSDRDEIVKTVPSGHQFLHSRIDISKVPQKHFRHSSHPQASQRGSEKEEKRNRK